MTYRAIMAAAAAVLIGTLLIGDGLRALDRTVVGGEPDLTKARALVKAMDWPSATEEFKRLETHCPNADVLSPLAFSQRKSGDFETS
jgi:hypothetical protein